MRLVQDKREFNNFAENILPDLEPDEVYFISLSCRTKYLDEYEREFYGLGNTTMFARSLVRSKDHFPAVIRSLEGELSTRLTKNGFLFPEKALVVYFNINPSSSVAAHMAYSQKMNVELDQVLKASMRDKEPNYLTFKRAERMLMDCFQTSTGTRHFLDIDCDTKELEYVLPLVTGLREHNVEHYVIETHGGYHVLVRRNTLNKSGMRLDMLVNDLHKKSGVEIMFNSNGMIPLPGTLQAGHLVKLVVL